MSITDFIAYLALIVSAVALWRAREVKQLDLRIELQKSFSDLDVVTSDIEDYLEFVCDSHLRVMAAIGLGRSGAEEAFKSEYAEDTAKLTTLLSSRPMRKDDYKRSSQEGLEREIIAIHSFRNQIMGLRRKYQEIFIADEERRKDIRAQHLR